MLPTTQLQAANAMKQARLLDELVIDGLVTSFLFFQYFERLVANPREGCRQGAFGSVAQLTVSVIFASSHRLG